MAFAMEGLDQDQEPAVCTRYRVRAAANGINDGTEYVAKAFRTNQSTQIYMYIKF